MPALTAVVGAVLFGAGLLLLSESGVGGAHVTAIGFSLFLAGLVATDWAADRWNLSPVDRRKWSAAFAVLALALLILFVVVNGATFELGEADSRSDSEADVRLS